MREIKVQMLDIDQGCQMDVHSRMKAVIKNQVDSKELRKAGFLLISHPQPLQDLLPLEIDCDLLEARRKCCENEWDKHKLSKQSAKKVLETTHALYISASEHPREEQEQLHEVCRSKKTIYVKRENEERGRESERMRRWNEKRENEEVGGRPTSLQLCVGTFPTLFVWRECAPIGGVEQTLCSVSRSELLEAVSCTHRTDVREG